jgi:hypothetical protein
MKGLRNTVLLPAGWEVASYPSQARSAIYQGRAFVAIRESEPPRTAIG